MGVQRSRCSPRTCRTPRQPPRAWARDRGRSGRVPWNAALQQHLAQVIPQHFPGARVRSLQITGQAPSPPSLPSLEFFPYVVELLDPAREGGRAGWRWDTHTLCLRLHPGFLFSEALGPNPRLLRAQRHSGLALPRTELDRRTRKPRTPGPARCPGLPARPYLVIGDVGARVGRRDGGGGSGREGSPEQGRAEPGAAHRRPQHAELSWAGPGPARRDSPAPPAPLRPAPLGAAHRGSPGHGTSRTSLASLVRMEKARSSSVRAARLGSAQLGSARSRLDQLGVARRSSAPFGSVQLR